MILFKVEVHHHIIARNSLSANIAKTELQTTLYKFQKLENLSDFKSLEVQPGGKF